MWQGTRLRNFNVYIIVSLLCQAVLLSAKYFVGFMNILEFTVELEIALWLVIDSSFNVEIFLFFALFFEFLVFVRFFVNQSARRVKKPKLTTNFEYRHCET